MTRQKKGRPDAALSTAKWSTAAHRAPLMLPAWHHGSTGMSSTEVVREPATAGRRRAVPRRPFLPIHLARKGVDQLSGD